MKLIRVFFLAGAIFVSNCLSAVAEDFATEMMEATFKVFHPDSTATCVLFQRPAPDKSIYLTTAAHTFERTKGETVVLVLRERKGDQVFERHDFTIAIRSGEKALWVKHPSEDIAVLRLTQPLPVPTQVLPLSALCDSNQISNSGLTVCSPLYVLTFPARFEANNAGFPVARQGIISSYPFLPVDRCHTFLSDFTTFSGDSGGPVFIKGSKGHPLVIGMVLAQFRQDERSETEYQEILLHRPMGLGSVIHAQFVRDTIEMAAKEKVSESVQK